MMQIVNQTALIVS